MGVTGLQVQCRQESISVGGGWGCGRDDRGGSLYRGAGGRGGRHTVKSKLNKFEHIRGGMGSLYGEVQCIMGNGHMGTLTPVDND